jgi:hypothetical protein
MTRDVPYFMAWNYGLLILGDPMITFISRMATETSKNDRELMNTTSRLKYAINPLLQKINITYSLPEASAVTIRLCDLSGRVKKVHITDSTPSGGQHSVQIRTKELRSGVYLILLQSDSYIECGQITLL